MFRAADKAVLLMLAHYFLGDHAFTSALLAVSEINKTKDIATKLLNLQFDVWVLHTTGKMWQRFSSYCSSTRPKVNCSIAGSSPSGSFLLS